MADKQVSAMMTYNDIISVTIDLDINFLMQIEYQGFDPEKTLHALLTKAAVAGKTLKQFAEDMQKVVLIYVQRGTNYSDSKFQQRSKTGAAAMITTLMNLYGIKPKLGTDTGPDVVSVARVVILFAEIAAAAYEARVARPVVEEPGLPLCFSFPHSPSIMSNDEWDTYKDKYMKWVVKFTRTINKTYATNNNSDKKEGSTGMTDDQIISQQQVYALNSKNSAFSIKNLVARKAKYNLLIKNFVTARRKNSGQDPADDKIDYYMMTIGGKI